MPPKVLLAVHVAVFLAHRCHCVDTVPAEDLHTVDQAAFPVTIVRAADQGRARHVLEVPFLNEEEDASNSRDSNTCAASLRQTIVLNELPGRPTGEWSGTKVWPSALVLLAHLHRTQGQGLRGLRILELGCGVPFVSSALVALGAEVCATEHPTFIKYVREAVDGPLLSGMEGTAAPIEGAKEAGGVKAGSGAVEGVTKAARARLRLQPLAWGDGTNVSALCGFDGPVDMLIGADLVYDGFPAEPLRKTIVSVLQDHGITAVLAIQTRPYPMVKALEQPNRVREFLRSLAAGSGGESWSMTVERPSLEALGARLDDDLASLVVVTLTPPNISTHSRAPAKSTPTSCSWEPLRYTREPLGSITKSPSSASGPEAA